MSAKRFKLLFAAGYVLFLAIVCLGIYLFQFYGDYTPLISGTPTKLQDQEVELSAVLGRAMTPKYVAGEPFDLNKKIELARAVASRLANYPAEYNKPDKLFLGEPTTVQVVVKTNDQQTFAPYFKGLEGEIAAATVRVANDVSAQLSAPPDRLKITLRGDKMRTISSPVPIAWVWDAEPLKPGKTQVILEVTSYIKTGKDKEPVPIRVFQDTWQVDATFFEWAKYQIQRIEPIQAFVLSLGSVFAGVLAWFGIKGWNEKKPDFET